MDRVAIVSASSYFRSCYYGERCFLYLVGIRGIKVYRFVFIVLVGAGSFLTLDLIWILADIVNRLYGLPELSRINWFTQRDHFRNQRLLPNVLKATQHDQR